MSPHNESATRTEKDPLGALEVPASALYGAQTVRATQNFPISGMRPLPMFVTAVVWIKKAAALTHKQTGRLDARLADAIIAAADEVLTGAHREHFVVDVFQAGAGTSHNMNVNEVLANLANERLGSARGSYAPIHPNDHVNMAQSTNDVIPTAIRLARWRSRAISSPHSVSCATHCSRRASSSTMCSRAAVPICRTQCRSGSARSFARTA